MDFDPFCVFLCFKVSLLVIVMLIDGSAKNAFVKAAFQTSEFACFEKRTNGLFIGRCRKPYPTSFLLLFR